MNLEKRTDIMARLGDLLQDRSSDRWQAILHKAYIHNKWFTPENTNKALDHLSGAFLAAPNLKKWVESYDFPKEQPTPKRVAIVMAGDIPMAGFHDLLCVFMSGHEALIKLSESDNILIPFLLDLLKEIDPNTKQWLMVVEKLSNFDAVIATGTDSSITYLETYFGKYPHLIRKNRNGIAVLDGSESEENLIALGQDVFQYFGLGSRSVSKIYVPVGYDFKMLLTALHEYREIQHHDKYKNNFDYNYTLIILNQMPHHANGCILIREDKAIVSRIASLHYEYYNNKMDLEQELEIRKNQIQCIIGTTSLTGIPTIPFGKAQSPTLFNYANEVDTMSFLAKL